LASIRAILGGKGRTDFIRVEKASTVRLRQSLRDRAFNSKRLKLDITRTSDRTQGLSSHEIQYKKSAA